MTATMTGSWINEVLTDQAAQTEASTNEDRQRLFALMRVETPSDDERAEFASLVESLAMPPDEVARLAEIIQRVRDLDAQAAGADDDVAGVLKASRVHDEHCAAIRQAEESHATAMKLLAAENQSLSIAASKSRQSLDAKLAAERAADTLRVCHGELFGFTALIPVRNRRIVGDSIEDMPEPVAAAMRRVVRKELSRIGDKIVARKNELTMRSQHFQGDTELDALLDEQKHLWSRQAELDIKFPPPPPDAQAIRDAGRTLGYRVPD